MQDYQQFNRIKLLTVRKNSGFCKDATAHHFHLRLVFSFLGYRARLNNGANAAEIASAIGLDARTVRDVLPSLGQLVRQDGRKWHAVEPPEDFFIKTRDADHWYDRLAYTMLLLPRKGAKIESGPVPRRFAMNHAAVYSYLVSFSKGTDTARGITVKGLATMLNGLNPKTIKAVLDDLYFVKLIERFDYGRSSDVRLLPFTHDHSALFQQREVQHPAEASPSDPVAEPVSQKAAPTRTSSRKPDYSYRFEGECWDPHLKVCQPYMPQKYAEEFVSKCLELGFEPWDCQEFLQKAWQQHRDNLATGKVKKGNFGAFVNMLLKPKVEERRQGEKIQRAQTEHWEEMASWSSDEHKAMVEERQKKVAADPNHPHFLADAQSIADRVQLEGDPMAFVSEADRLEKRLWKHCVDFIGRKSNDYQTQITEGGNLCGDILKSALGKLNHFYKQEVRATLEEFQAGVDEAIQTIQGMPPIHW